MEKIILFFAFLIPCSLFSQSELQFISQAEQKGFGQNRIAPQSQAINNSDFIYHRCEWNIDPAVYYINGKVTTYFIPNSTITQMEFDLSDSLQVDSVKFHGSNISFTHSAEILGINFPSSLPASAVDSVTAFYHGIPPSTGFGSYDTSMHAGVPVLWTLSEPYGAKDWWPCKQNLYDKIDSIDILVTSPAIYTTASNGILAKDTVIGIYRTCTWKHRYPIAAYLVCFATTNYSVYTHLVPFNGDTVTVINYAYPEDIVNAQNGTANIISQMQLFDTLFGAYPFADEKYGHAQCNFGGGMEHQTITFVGGFSYELLSHELGHHWFGDKVTCGSWHDIWLNEGFASYLSGICYEHFAPTLYWMPFKQGRISYITSLPDGSVYCPDTVNIPRIFDGRLSYAKGAMVLHTLRWVIGDSAFYAGVRNYLNDVSRAYNFARTIDLQQHLEAASGQNLTWYFDDWIYGEGFPSYTISWSQSANNIATFTVNQSQSHASVPFYELPLPIRFKNATQDTIIRVSNTFSGQPFSVQLSFQADSLIFDPDYWIISANNTINNVQQQEIDYSFELYPNPAGNQLFIHAGNAYSGNAVTKIYDAAGKLVLENNFIFSNSSSTEMINTEKLEKGAYFISVQTERNNFTMKFIKGE
ncbi:MAG: T9SS type A sorting domain-containing protein [Bacteroidota bacterium]|nr:T9SS type A sorting domain-containing protein [Bacteroidota bacterium]